MNRILFKLGALALIVVLVVAGVCQDDSPKGRAVVLISIDTLRQDHLGCYGYGRNTTPAIDRFAREDAVLFESAYAQAPYTLTSHMSMLTGLYPEAHGMLQSLFKKDSSKVQRLSEKVTTVAESFSKAGFKTAAFTDGGFIDHKYGFDQGFDLYMDDHHPLHRKNGFRKLRKPLKSYIKESSGEDFFVFVHTYDTHAPYQCPEPFRSQFKDAAPGRELPAASLMHASLLGCHQSLGLSKYADLQEVVDAYDSCIAFTDNEVGKLFQLMKDQGIWEDATVIVTSDHGESFMENGLVIGHGMSAANEETRIPLLVKFPRGVHPGGGQRVKHIVESVDLMPTLLSACHLPVPVEVQGQDLIAGINSGSWTKSFAYGVSPFTGRNRYMVSKEIKYIEAVNDIDGLFLKTMITPMCPPFSERPRSPYYMAVDQPYYYDFNEDLLGLDELFNRGDRAYDMTNARFEWNAEPVRSKRVLMNFKEAVALLSRQSSELGRQLGETTVAGETVTTADIEKLNSLGYSGMLACQGGANAAGQTCCPEEEFSCALKEDTPLTDRSLLIQGDASLWEVQRAAKRRSAAPGRNDIQRQADLARSCYEAFKALNPSKSHWVSWRIRYLDRAMKSLGLPVFHAEKVTENRSSDSLSG